MKKRRRVIAIVIVFVLIIVLASACSDKGKEGRQPGDPAKAIFITQALSNSTQAFSWSEFQRHMGDYNIDMTVIAGEGQVEAEIQGIEKAIKDEFDVIFCYPSDIEAVIPVLTQAKEAGIIIGMFFTDLPPQHQHVMDFFCGSDIFAGGQMAGGVVSQQFPDGANFVEVGGLAGDDDAEKLYNGFRTGIADNIIELGSRNCVGGWNEHEARAIMEDFLFEFGDQINIVWCHWDIGVSAVIEATQTAGRHDIFIIGVGGNKTGFRQVRDGYQSLSIGHSYSNMVIKSLENARTLLDGGTVDTFNIIPMDLITPETVDSLPWPE